MDRARNIHAARFRAALPWLFLAAVSLFLAVTVDRYLTYARPFVRYRMYEGFMFGAEHLYLFYCLPAVSLITACLAMHVRWLRRSGPLVIASVFLCSVHLLFAYVILWFFPPRFGEPIPTGPAPALRAIIEQADRATLYSIWPWDDLRKNETEASRPPFEGELHEFPVLGKVTLADAKTRSQVLQALLTSIEDNFGGEKLCFSPRHALRLGRGTDEIDVMICYRCGYMIISKGEETERVCLSASSKATLNRVLRNAGVTLAPE